MQSALTKEDIKAGLPHTRSSKDNDASTLYVEWNELRQKFERQLKLVDDLDKDINRMSVWSDFPMSRIDQLAQSGQSIKFWKAKETVFDREGSNWVDSYQAELVNRQDGSCYFVTVTPIGSEMVLQGAEQVEVTPSPVSTLISLQTRAKDSLRALSVQRGDFALEHYHEIESALGLKDTLKIPSKRRRFMSKIKKILRAE